MPSISLPPMPSDRRFRILIVEDDATISRLAALNLKAAGHAIFVARDAMEALNQLSQINPHLILSDIHMPGMSGHELAKRVRDVSLVPIVLMTAHDSEQVHSEGLKLGADDYIAKPFTPELLTARVAANLRRVYHYNGIPPKARTAQTSQQAVPSSGLPRGFVRCDSCQYVGPVWKFEQLDNDGNKITACPLCHTKNITFALS